MAFTREDLKYLQALPLHMKVQKSVAKILEWHARNKGQVYVSFSGGKDSTVLLYLVRQLFPDVKAVFVNTGLEYPEVVTHARSVDNLVELRPAMNFRTVIEKHGYPVISKDVAKLLEGAQKGAKWAKVRLDGFNIDGQTPNDFRKGMYGKWKYLADAPFKISAKCCDEMKKKPVAKFEKETGLKPYLGTLASESRLRTARWLENGCNAFDSKRQYSAPLSFWTENDILEYIKHFDIPIATVYGQIQETNKGYHCTKAQRTGCVFCLFGCHLDKLPNRIQRLADTHPKLYEYCLRDWEQGGLGLTKVMEFVGIPHDPKKENKENNE